MGILAKVFQAGSAIGIGAAIVLLLLPAAASAVELGPFGFSGGGSWVTQTFEYDEGYEFVDPVDGGIIGPVIGAFLRAQMRDGVAVGLEMLYLQKGITSTYVVTDTPGEPVGDETESYRAHYLSIPAILRLETTGESTNLFFFGGLSADILLSDDEFYELLNLNTATLAVHAGIGLGWGRWELSVRYLGDLTNAVDPGPEWTLQSVKSRGVIALVSFDIWTSDGGPGE